MTAVQMMSAMLRHWRMVVVLPAVFATVTAAWTLAQPRNYVASASFIPQAREGQPAGGAAALAQQFGVNINVEAPGQSPQFYVDLLRSSFVLREAVESQYEVRSSDGAVKRATLIEMFNVQSGPLPDWRQAADQLQESLHTSVARETGVVRLSLFATGPEVAEQVAGQLLAILEQFNLDIRRQRAQAEGHFILARISEIERDLDAAESALQNFLRQNREFRNSPELMFEHDRLQRSVGLRHELLTSLMRSNEQVRIDGVRDIPTLTFIDRPEGSARPVPRGTGVRVVLALALGFMVAAAFSVGREFGKRNQNANDANVAELRMLARQAWGDLRRPRRWVAHD